MTEWTMAIALFYSAVAAALIYAVYHLTFRRKDRRAIAVAEENAALGKNYLKALERQIEVLERIAIALEKNRPPTN